MTARKGARDLAGSTRAKQSEHQNSNITGNRHKPKREAFATVGTFELCGWQVAPGICWVQTRLPRYADKLRKRSDARRAVYAVRGPYLVTFSLQRPLGFIEKLICRYTRNLPAPNETFRSEQLAASASELPGSEE
jgi:hypothetical protein